MVEGGDDEQSHGTSSHAALDLAIFNLAIDSKLQGCDVVARKVEDVAPNGYSVDQATMRQDGTDPTGALAIAEQVDM